MASRNPETQPTLTLHAEFLPNIRQTTLYITLPTNLDPIISLSESRRAVTVSLPEPYDDVSETIKLPARVNEAARRVLEGRQHTGTGNGTRQKGELGSISRPGSGNWDERELSFRMQIDPGDTGGGLLRPDDEVTSEEYVPWMAGDMGSYTRLGCRGCGKVVLDCAPAPAPGDTGSGWVWKDLPSGNWAEMMDFWHCHKPDTHDHDHGDHTVSIEERNSQVKGYGAANQVVASSGTGLVDVATFLVAEGDCRGLQIQNENSKKTSITCTQCNALIGLEDPIANGWRLLKAALSAYTPSTTEEKGTWHTHPTETVVAAQLLELVERESARRFVVHYSGKDGLLLWVFNPDLRYSTTSTSHSTTTTAHRGMKILFQETSTVEDLLSPENGKPSSLSLEELKLPSDIYKSVYQTLVERNAMLPVSARGFREWRVGILERFERSLNTE
ncbi:hypothetical protein SI65_09355 [Aspergillus cristatus]|uniref:Ubiquitin-conjugating enzyme E2-binding protein n=1 Tax=Aspergillus cristatus TaxID=573508 RepID=A0A1E3B3W3_ASPCR|nr:hypothetical protein SI65_09355 [Aspergillus cristatus]